MHSLHNESPWKELTRMRVPAELQINTRLASLARDPRLMREQDFERVDGQQLAAT